ncbi:1-(5-phosphoribosyl)-5-[(5-phosphoribosylamino)methylideneamino]imidazole-4-carboxamide isomerase [Arachidicoccus sp.]|uniref:1-(5-phosphoribosyl)-5-[(5- phosphoribosylamino)methylideneamino]imidazole-4- carboxamide isomerase n=1 Tax=Arachidicoccus sp. TaxID=1872624 RepID=UPI003D21C81B
MTIIPAIDIIDGKCVRLTQGDYMQKTIYHENPVDVAKSFEDIGLQRLHLVDLDGAKAGKVTNWKVLENITASTNMIIDFGGGIKQKEDVELVLNSGAKYATIGSLAVKDEALFSEWIENYDPERFLLGADVKDEKITISGWLETTDIDIFSFIKKYTAKGINNVFCTDVSKDGLLQGPSIDLYKKIIAQFPAINFIASGGVSNIDDLKTLQSIGCSGAIVGKAIYEGKINLEELISEAKRTS